MEVFPSEYQNLSLSRYEKLFVRHSLSMSGYGLLLLRVNPSMQSNEDMNVVILPEGLVFIKFFDDFDKASDVIEALNIYTSYIYPATTGIIVNKLISNKAICDSLGKLRFASTLVYAFCNIQKKDIISLPMSSTVQDFVEHHCLFAEDFGQLRNNYASTICKFLATPMTPVSSEPFSINNNNVNSILHRIATEYVTVRVMSVEDKKPTSRGADEELLIIDENDKAAKAFRLDQEQINIVNKISKGDQLILACAGSGKSVLLIAKCFKAARANPDKQFLITCFNNNLCSLYQQFIDRAGLRERNVLCLTFDQLCIHLLGAESSRYSEYEALRSATIDRLNSGKITQRFYGIFIDEVQIFHPEWYKFCYNLLENKDSEDHIFVICGDKTQDLEKKKRHGTAPWQAGEGYPSYRGGNKNIRIERNYRNCIEINEFINRFVTKAKQYLYSIEPTLEIDPDLFLRGQATTHGEGVKHKQLTTYCNDSEADAVIKAVQDIHDNYDIPYDEIAIIMYNGAYSGRIPGWRDRPYMIEQPLIDRFEQKDIPYTRLYKVDGERREHLGEHGGVKMLKFLSTLGLDFRAAIICGLKPLGFRDGIKAPNWDELKQNEESYSNAVQSTHTCIRNLYVACTRAKELLYIISPEPTTDSIFIKLLKDSIN